MIVRLATVEDIEGIKTLQQKYLINNLPVTKLAEGFVTTPFTDDQIKTVIALSGLFIAELNQEIVGYTFSSTWEFFSQWPIFPYMASRFPNLKFNGVAIGSDTSFQYGPICIDQSQRGTGLFQELFERMRIGMHPKFPIGITFINKINKRSYEAHTKKLNLIVIDEFSFNQNEYYTLAFSTQPSLPLQVL